MKNRILDLERWKRTGLWGGFLAVAVILTLTFGKMELPPSPADSLTPLTPTAQSTSQDAPIQTAYGNLPLIFEANQGQTDPSVRFLSRGMGYTLFLTQEEAVFNLQFQPSSTVENPGVNYTTLRMRLVDANPQPEITGLEALPTRIHYLRGQDAQRWRTDVPTYARVLLQEVYPGIDLVYYGNQRQLQYDFVVAPGVDPQTIRLAFAGPNEPVRPVLAENGDLLLAVNHGEVRWSKPLIYQDIEGQRHFIEGSFTLDEDPAEIGFAIAAYDRTQPLVIDPVLAYSTFLGGIQQDYGTSIAVDREGHAYVTGATASINFPVAPLSPPPYSGVLAGVKTLDAFVTKLNATGTGLIYSTFLGGTDDKDDIGYGIALDDSGQAYITGMTASSDFPGSSCPLGGQDAFITILDPIGSSLMYSTCLGGTKDDAGRGIALGPQPLSPPLRMIYITGHTNSTDIFTYSPPFLLPFQPALLGGVDAFVSQINPNNNTVVYSTYLGGARDDRGAAIALDGAGNIYVTGSTASTNFPVTGSSFATTLQGRQSGFVAKINPTPPGRNSLVYSAYLGGRGTDSGAAIAVDRQHYAYVTGTTTSSDFPVTPNALLSRYAGNGDAFVTRIYPTGTALAYSTYLGGSGADSGAGIVVTENPRGDIYTYVTGATASTNFPVTPGAFDQDFGPGRTSKAFVAQLNEAGDRLLYATYLGGTNNADRGAGIAVDIPARNITIGDGFDNPYHVYGVYVTGATSASDFPVTFGAFDTVNSSSEDAFVTKLGAAPVDLRIELTCDPNRGASFPILCKIDAYNDAITNPPPPAPLTTLTVVLPANVTLSSPSFASYGSCRTVLTTLICEAAPNRPLNYGPPFSAIFTLIPSSSEPITLTARIAAAVNDENLANNTVTLNVPTGSFHTLTVSRSGAGMGTVTSNPAGIDCGNICTADFLNGTNVTLTAIPGTDPATYPATTSTFAGWSGACSGASPSCSVSVSQALSTMANFDSSPPPDDHGDSPGAATPIPIGGSTAGILERGGDEDYFQISVPPPGGTLTVETTGSTDTYGYLINHPGYQVNASDDNGGAGLNFRISLHVNAGIYYVRVRGSTPTTIGPYSLITNFVPGFSGPSTILIEHYYVSILGRPSGATEMSYWQSRVHSAPSFDVKPVFRDMAHFFFNSPEYLSKGTPDTQFVTDLYLTFFQRVPDAGGMNFWLAQLAGGMSRDQVMSGFLHSPEFTSFMQGLGF